MHFGGEFRSLNAFAQAAPEFKTFLQTSINGFFGHIQFDTFGGRSNYSVLVTEYKDGSIVKVRNRFAESKWE